MLIHPLLNALCISDLQVPAEHRDALDFVKHVDKIWFPTRQRIVINQGDEVDQHTLGKWPANPDGLSGGHELNEARVRLSYWGDEFPDMRLCTSNHTYRAWKKAFLSGIPSEFMRSVGEVYKTPPGWLWKDKWLFDNWCFEHGENVSGAMAALNAAVQNGMNTSIGHQHSHGGVISRANANGVLFGLNTGCLIDVDQYNFDYGKNIRIKPSLGMGVIKNSIPYFIPMILNHQKRWIGYI